VGAALQRMRELAVQAANGTNSTEDIGSIQTEFAAMISEIDRVANNSQFNNLSILPNAEMGDPDYQRKYGMEIIETEIINIHGSLSETREEILEMQQLVIATASMPREDWARTRSLCWMTAFLHFDKVLQIPLILVHETSSISYRDLIEAFMNADEKRFPVITQIRNFFVDIRRAEQLAGQLRLSKDRNARSPRKQPETAGENPRSLADHDRCRALLREIGHCDGIMRRISQQHLGSIERMLAAEGAPLPELETVSV